MSSHPFRPLLISTMLFLSPGILSTGLPAQADEPIPLWPGKPPGDESLELPAEGDTNGPDAAGVAGRPIIRLGNVSTPTLQVFAPDPAIASGTSVIICPGGGHSILAYDLEGTEVAEWLSDLGITAFVLKYRVPARPGRPRHEAAVQDAQRALSLVRDRAAEFKLNPDRIGILGFSAGGQTAALAALTTDRTYQPIDEVDKAPHAANFAILIYPAYLVDNQDTTRLVDGVTVTKQSPPMFLVHTWDDPVTPQSSLQLAAALKQVGVKSELHMFDRGGHGYGMRLTENPVTRWPDLCEDWLRVNGWLGEATDQQQIRTLIANQQTAWNEGDIEAYMSAYLNSDALTFSTAGEVTRGYRATLERYKKRYPTTAEMGNTTFSNLDIQILSSNSALVLGDWQLDRANDPIGGGFSLVMQKVDGGWKIIHDHTSRK